MPHLRASGRGRIVNLASVAAIRGAALITPYVASKFGLVGVTQSLALEFAADNLTVNAVLPGTTPTTKMGRELLDEKVARGWAGSHEDVISRTAAGVIPLGRVGTVLDVAQAVYFLVSEGASFITGHSLVVDGGSSIAWPAMAPPASPAP